MEKWFQISFFTGTLFTIITFMLGSVFGSNDSDVDLDTDLELDVDTDMDMDTDIEVSDEGGFDFALSRIIALKPSTLAAFTTVFGGVGMIGLKKGLSVTQAALWASMLGLIVVLILTHLIINPLKRAQSTSAVSQESLIGHTAIAKLAMRGQRFGQIAYSVNGSKYSAPAKSATGRPIAKGATVTVVSIVKGVFFVDIKKEDEKCL